MPTLADIFAAGGSVKGPDGQVIKLRPLTIEEGAEFQVWCEDRAHAAVDRSKAPPEEKERHHHLINRDAGLGYYEWEGPLAAEACQTLAGLAKVVELVARGQGVTGERAEAIVKHNATEVARLILTRNRDDPKFLPRLLAELGLSTDSPSSASDEPSCSDSATRRSDDPPTSSNCASSPTTNSCSSTTSGEAPTG